MTILDDKGPTRFPKTINDKNGNRITEFDGIIVLTNSHELCTYLNGGGKKNVYEYRHPDIPDVVVSTNSRPMYVCGVGMKNICCIQ